MIVDPFKHRRTRTNESDSHKMSNSHHEESYVFNEELSKKLDFADN